MTSYRNSTGVSSIPKKTVMRVLALLLAVLFFLPFGGSSFGDPPVSFSLWNVVSRSGSAGWMAVSAFSYLFFIVLLASLVSVYLAFARPGADSRSYQLVLGVVIAAGVILARIWLPGGLSLGSVYQDKLGFFIYVIAAAALAISAVVLPEQVGGRVLSVDEAKSEAARLLKDASDRSKAAVQGVVPQGGQQNQLATESTDAQVASAAMSTCPNCQASIQGIESFCRECGAKLQ